MEEHYKVADTNLFLLDPAALDAFKKKDKINYLIIPFAVLEELDKFKDDRDDDARRRNARKTLEKIKEYKAKYGGSLMQGINVGKNYIIKSMYQYNQIVDEKYGKALSGISNNNDIKILKIALSLKEEGKNVELVTNDNGLFDIADALGLEVNDWIDKRAVKNAEDIYKGWRDIYLLNEQINLLRSGKKIDLKKIGLENVIANEYLNIISKENGTSALRARYDAMEKKINQINDSKKTYSIGGLNMHQRFAIDALTNPSIEIVHLIGVAGTGKTLLALAAGLEQAADEEIYDVVMAARPIVTVGHDIGFLPGDVQEKLSRWMQPIYDNLDYLVEAKNKKDKREHIEYLFDQGMISIEPLTYIRGRSLPKRFFIIDEAQNLDPDEIKTIITRAGKGTKIVLTGDPTQIDKKALSALTNGLVYSSEKFKGQPNSATIYLTECERSGLAAQAAKLL